MTITIFSVLFLTLAAWILGRVSSLKVCPICVGVSLTWFWLFVGLSLGQLSVANYQLPTIMLMGGTVVGLAFKLEHYINSRRVMIWKTLFISLGFAVAYNLVINQWFNFLLFLIAALASFFVFKSYGSSGLTGDDGGTKKLQEKLKNCC